MAEGKAPIVDTAKAGWDFMRSSISVLFPAAALAAVFNAAAQTLLAPDPSPNPGLGLIMLLLALAATIAYTAFAYRLILREDASGFFGLKASRDELNLLGVSIAVGFLVGIVAIIGFMVVMFAFVAVAAGAGIDFSAIENDPAAAEAAVAQLFSTPSGLFVVAAGVAAIWFLMWISVRLALIAPATIGEQKMMAFSTWKWTKGNSLQIFLALMLTILPLLLVILIAAAAIGMSVGAAMGDAEAALTPKADNLIPHAVFQFVVAMGQFVLLTPAQAGAVAYLYRGLRPPTLT